MKKVFDQTFQQCDEYDVIKNENENENS
jgi:hypothetical protein